MKRRRIILCCALAAAAFSAAGQARGQEGGGAREWLKNRASRKAAQRSSPGDGAAPAIAAKINSPGDYTLTVEHGGAARKYRIHVPEGYTGKKPAPLLMAFHGGGGNSAFMANDKYYGLPSKADKEGFVAVFPDGASRLRGKLATWNAGDCCGYARDSRSDDVGFVDKILKDLRGRLNLDAGRTYAAGMSNGGMFVYRLACDRPGVFRAIASVTGTDNYSGCAQPRPVPVLHIHAENDTHILFGGGAGPDAFRDQSKVTDFTSVTGTIEKWLKRNGCKGSPERVVKKDGVYCDLYRDCKDGALVKLCVTSSGGHSWPGAKAKPTKRSDSPSSAISATDEIWDFFSGLP